jgi:hypothetical protein
MWRHEPFTNILESLLQVDSVDEVIIINNDVSRTPDSDSLKHSKIRMHNSASNLYVNPSWNLGAKLAKNSRLCFFSDDIDVDLRVFDKVKDFMNTEIGMIGILSPYFEEPSYKKFLTDGSIDIVDAAEPDAEKRPPPIGIGNLFFLNKKDWKPIPEELKIFHGEIIQWNRLGAVKRNYIITNCRIETPGHVTWQALANEIPFEFNKIQKSDQSICESKSFLM